MLRLFKHSLVVHAQGAKMELSFKNKFNTYYIFIHKQYLNKDLLNFSTGQESSLFFDYIINLGGFKC